MEGIEKVKKKRRKGRMKCGYTVSREKGGRMGTAGERSLSVICRRNTEGGKRREEKEN